MRKVFIHKIDNTYEVIDKNTGYVIDRCDDVIIFNGEYRRHNNLKGWHGILSEEINPIFIRDILANHWVEIRTIPKLYYPRFQTIPVKKCRAVKFYQGKEYIRGSMYHYNEYKLADLTQSWEDYKYDNDEDEDYDNEL